MTARKNASEKDEKTVGKDESKDVQTTKQAEEVEVPTSAEKREPGETDVEGAAEGEVAGGVVLGDVGLEDEDSDEDDYYEFEADSEELEGAEGTVVESNIDGDQFDVPYVHVSGSLVHPRTSDSDDPAKSWTAQEASEVRKDDDDNDLDTVALVPVAQTPGQTFRVRELPNRKVAEAAGIDYDQFIAGLPVRADVPHEAPRRGTPA